MHPAPAEQQVATTPFMEAQSAIAGLRAGEFAAIARSQEGSPITVGPDAPNLLEADESPFGIPVRLAISAGYEQSQSTFFIADVRGIEPEPIGDGRWGRRLDNGVVITSPTVTHLLINRYFSEGDSPVLGYKGLRPGESVTIGRNLADGDAKEIMQKRFGLFPAVPSRISANQASVTLSSDGESISVADHGSRYGTWITTRRERQQPTNRKGLAGRALRAAGLVRDDGAYREPY